MAKKKNKVELIEEVVDTTLTDGTYNERYWGNVVKDGGNNYNYFSQSGTEMSWISEEIANLLLSRQHVINEVVSVDELSKLDPKDEVRDPGVVSMLDLIGTKPKSVNIEF